MSGWGEYAAAWALFLLSHAMPVRPPLKPWLIARLGQTGFLLGYSVLSLGVLAWLIIAAGRAPHVSLWPMPVSAHWIVLAGMIPAVALLALTLGRPNPFSFGGARNGRFDPDHPELIGRIRHPVLAALGFWAAAHLVANGDLAHALMFAGFGGFAVLGMALIDRRKQRETGRAEWQALQARARHAAPAFPPNAALRLLMGFCSLTALIAGHQWLSGVAIWPRFLP